ncbi:MAG: GAF domain-containing protein [Deltaproteobacteria bacterium]|nr:GAF domain-containing protein [Deltaproteobacteria bacterium]
MEKEVCCVNSRAIVNYVKKYDKGLLDDLFFNLDPELDLLTDKEGFLTDHNNWISCTVASKLYERARILLKDEMAAFNIARFAVENFHLGYLQWIIIRAFWSTKNVLNALQKINDRYNRNKRIELVEIKGNNAVVRFHWNPKMEVSKDICLYNQGIYSFMPIVWGGKPAIIEEECCYFNGAPYCEYKLKWSVQNRFYEIFSKFFKSKTVLAETIAEMDRDKKLLEKKYEEVNLLNIQLNDKIRQLQAIQETGKAILSVLNLENLLTVIMNTLSNICCINRAIIMIVNEKDEHLEYLHATGFTSDIPGEVKNYRVSLKRVNNILVRVTNTGRSEYIPDVNSSTLRKDNIVLIYGKPKSVFVVPLITRSKVIGVIATDAVDGEGVPDETRSTLEVFAPQIAIAIENARLYKKLQEQMTELKRSHTLLSRTEKLAFLGDLAARLAHEIKNPMTAIGTFIQMLPYKFDDKEYRENFHKIAMEETERVNGLISELLDLVNTKETKFESSPVHELIDKMVLLVSPQSNAKRIKVQKEYDPELFKVWLDSEKFKQIILNLLSNAVEFTPEHGNIRITTLRNPKDIKEGLCIRIIVEDNGEGIPKSTIDKIFNPYFTTKHKSKDHKGTGLGLFIVHQNVHDHGGTIEVRSRINEGTQFIIDLPMHPDNEKRSEIGDLNVN